MKKTDKQQVITAFIMDKKGKVLSVGQNSYVKTHPLQALHAQRVGLEKKIYLHAEIAAIARCPDLSRAYKMYITRFDTNGNPVLAKPCPVCESAIHATPIRRIDHT